MCSLPQPSSRTDRGKRKNESWPIRKRRPPGFVASSLTSATRQCHWSERVQERLCLLVVTGTRATLQSMLESPPPVPENRKKTASHSRGDPRSKARVWCLSKCSELCYRGSQGSVLEEALTGTGQGPMGTPVKTCIRQVQTLWVE